MLTGADKLVAMLSKDWWVDEMVNSPLQIPYLSDHLPNGFDQRPIWQAPLPINPFNCGPKLATMSLSHEQPRLMKVDDDYDNHSSWWLMMPTNDKFYGSMMANDAQLSLEIRGLPEVRDREPAMSGPPLTCETLTDFSPYPW